MKVIVKDNAKLDEIKAFYILKHDLFQDKTVIVGDDYLKLAPDLYTDDLNIGVEVVSCEHISSYLMETLITNHFNNFNKTFINNFDSIINEYQNLSLGEKQKLFNAEFENLVDKKLRKMCNYKGVKKCCLFVISDNEEKHFIRREKLIEIYKKCCEKRKVSFNELYFYYNKTLYKLVDNNFKKIKTDFNQDNFIK